MLFVIPKNGSMTEIERYDYTGRGTRLNLYRKIQLVLFCGHFSHAFFFTKSKKRNNLRV